MGILADNVLSSRKQLILIGSSLITVYAVHRALIWWQQKKKQLERIPTQWKPVGKIKNIYIYPLKSAKAIELKKAECTLIGLKEPLPEGENNGDGKFRFIDRYFMIYQENSMKSLTARQKHKLLLMKIESAGQNSVKLIYPDIDEDITIEINPKKDTTLIKCGMITGEEVELLDCGDDAAKWLSKVLYGKDNFLRLGYYPDENKTQRNLSQESFKKNGYLQKFMRDADFGALSDIASYMILTDKSFDDLKSRLNPEENYVNIRYFRPNLVVSGPDISAYEEDNWKWLKIGDEVVLRGFIPCTRCAMVNLDPDKGIPNPTKEPLITLKKYRKVIDPKLKKYEGESPVFGRYFGLHIKGNISVGDTIYIPA